MFQHNGAVSLNAGGALYASYSQVTIFNSTFTKNSASSGGAFHLSFCQLDLENARFYDNRASVAAGAAYLFNSSVVARQSVTYSGNQAPFMDHATRAVYALNVTYSSPSYQCQTAVCTFGLSGN